MYNCLTGYTGTWQCTLILQSGYQNTWDLYHPHNNGSDGEIHSWKVSDWQICTFQSTGISSHSKRYRLSHTVVHEILQFVNRILQYFKRGKLRIEPHCNTLTDINSPAQLFMEYPKTPTDIKFEFIEYRNTPTDVNSLINTDVT
jgi:hypothetical protein